MEPSTRLRVVIAGPKLRQRAFRLRQGEKGLSLFGEATGVDAEMVIATLRRSGKRGPLAVAELYADDIQRLGLVLVKTRVETGNPLVDACHYEARLSEQQRESLKSSSLDMIRYFNEEIAPRLCQLARPFRGPLNGGEI